MALVAMAMFPAVGGANAKLWLYPEGVGPRNGGYVIGDSSFNLVVENVGTGGGDNTAYSVALLIALNDPTLLASGSITLPDGTVVDLTALVPEMGIPSMPCSGATIPPHSVYPTSYLEIPLGDLAEGGIWQIPVNVSGEAHLEAHFDATAEGFRQTGHGMVCYDVVNPSGHDVTLALQETTQPTCPELRISKSADTTGVALGEEVDYTIEVANQGDCDLTEVVITEDIPTVDDSAGNPVPAFEVVATDPAPSGQDGESLTWALGAPVAPGTSVTVSVTALFNETSAEGQEVVNTACVETAETGEEECDDAEVAVGESPAEEEDVTGAGFWCNRIRLALLERPGAGYTVAELEDLLALVDEQSGVFSELVDATTAELAQPLLCTPRNIPAADKLVRQLLALWLNVVSDRLDPALTLGDLCAGEEAMPPGTDTSLTVAEVIASAEDALQTGAERATLLQWMELADFINNASMGPDCDEGPTTVSEPLMRRSHGRRK